MAEPRLNRPHVHSRAKPACRGSIREAVELPPGLFKARPLRYGLAKIVEEARAAKLAAALWVFAGVPAGALDLLFIVVANFVLGQGGSISGKVPGGLTGAGSASESILPSRCRSADLNGDPD